MLAMIQFILLLINFQVSVFLISASTDVSDDATNNGNTAPFQLSTANTCEEQISGVYECIGIVNATTISSLVPSDAITIVFIKSNLTLMQSHHLQHFTKLQGIDIIESQVQLSLPAWPASLPLRSLRLEKCWSNVTDMAAAETMSTPSLRPHLVVQPQIWSELATLLRLELVQCNLTVQEQPDEAGKAGFLHLPPSCKLLIQGGAFECKSNHVYLVRLVAERRAQVSNSTTCFVLENISMFNPYFTFNDKPLLKVLGLIDESNALCPPRCRCTLLGFRTMVRPLLSVNCKGARLNTLPRTIPPLASTLLMSHNNLSSLDAMFQNPNYSRLANCDFSHNSISRINGTALVAYLARRSHDIKFDLRHNNLTTFPVWELTSYYVAAQRTGEQHLPVFDLSGNPWDCFNCSFIPYFKSFVYDNMFSIRDHVDVGCAGSKEQILYVDFVSRCHPPASLLLPIDVLNIFMALLLALFLADFAYNYYQYRRHGKLPWIVRTCKIC